MTMTMTTMDWTDVITSIHGALWEVKHFAYEASYWFMGTHLRVTPRGLYLEYVTDNDEGVVETVWEHFIGVEELTELFDYSKWLDGVLAQRWSDEIEDHVFEVWKNSSMINKDWVTVLKAIQGPLWEVKQSDCEAFCWFMATHIRVTARGLYLKSFTENCEGVVETVWEHFIGVEELTELFDYSKWLDGILDEEWLDQAEKEIFEVWYKIHVK